MDLTSFSHGQIQSKLWLCSVLEPHLSPGSDIAILGSWYNVLAFMMMVRKPEYYHTITGLDIDPDATMIADKICDAWRFDDGGRVYNETKDSHSVDYSAFNAIISCSVEHMVPGWYEDLPPGMLVCLQSSDVGPEKDGWNIVDHNPTMEVFLKKYPMSRYLYTGEKNIDYGVWGYNRFMIVGIR